MKRNLTLLLGVLLVSSLSHANYSLLLTQRPIVCYGPDNQSILYNVHKGIMKYTVEGESNGFKKISRPNTNGRSYIIVETSEVILQISNQGDFFKVKGSGDDRFTRADCDLSKQID